MHVGRLDRERAPAAAGSHSADHRERGEQPEPGWGVVQDVVRGRRGDGLVTDPPARGEDREERQQRGDVRAIRDVAERGWLPVPLFCAGGIATPADASLTMQLGAEGNFVGSGIFKSADPERTAKAIVEATTHFEDAARVLAASTDLGEPMRGDDIADLAADGELLQQRGW